ncbi:MAG: hypothetical protein RL326_1237 [Pseudomonadota bacterium]|jgi:hypothetical protein
MGRRPDKISSMRTLEERDRALRQILARGKARLRKGAFRNADLARWYSAEGRDVKSFDHLEEKLERKGLFDIRFERHRWKDADGSTHTHLLARAAVTDMWPMGTSYWLRDNAIIGARFLRSRDKTRRRLGLQLLLSGLTFMASIAQRDRFKAMIRSKRARYIDDPRHWPYIFADIKTNLSCQNVEGWAHKQDAWQILAFHVLGAIETKLISLRELDHAHREFLALIIPFLANVECWKCENSGSWEEIPSVRTSVRAWEHRLIVKLGELSERAEYTFLSSTYKQVRRHLSPAFRGRSLRETADILDRKLCAAMLRDVPFESPHYSRRDPRFRESDAALFYLLELDYPDFLAARAGKTSRWAKRLESRLLSRIVALQDDVSGGIYRYANDTYQREGYFRNVTVAKLNEMYGGPSADASSNFSGRETILPAGRKAAWTHFVWQLCWWSAQRYLETQAVSYLQLHERLFKAGLGLVTGAQERSLDVGANGVSRVVRIPAWRMPECYIAERAPNGRELVIPSPHTPLNWAIAEMVHAFTLRRQLLSQK